MSRLADHADSLRSLGAAWHESGHEKMRYRHDEWCAAETGRRETVTDIGGCRMCGRRAALGASSLLGGPTEKKAVFKT